MSEQVFSEEQKEEIEKILQSTIGKCFRMPEEYLANAPSFFLNSKLNELKSLIIQNERAIRHNYEYLVEKMATKGNIQEIKEKMATKESIVELKNLIINKI